MIHIIEVRRPKYTLWQRFLKWWYGYSRSWEKYQKALPCDGDIIKLTALTDPRNHPGTKNINIGSVGMVFDMDKNEGIFCLRLQSKATLVMTGRDFDYIKLN